MMKCAYFVWVPWLPAFALEVQCTENTSNNSGKIQKRIQYFLLERLNLVHSVVFTFALGSGITIHAKEGDQESYEFKDISLSALGVNKENFSNDVGKTVFEMSATESGIIFNAEVDFELSFS